MKRMHRTLACLIYIVACTGSLNANALDVNSLILGKFDSAIRANRLQIASSVEESINKLVALLPIQKPQEISWVNEEGAALDSMDNKYSNHRYFKLYNSPEFRHLQLTNHLSNISSAIRCIKSEPINIAMEMYCWNELSLGLQDSVKFKENILILIRDGRLSKDVESITAIGGESLGHGYFLRVFGSGIQQHIISPFLFAQAK